MGESLLSEKQSAAVTAPEGIDPASTLSDMIFGFRNTQAIYVVAKLGIPDYLRDGPVGSAELAKRLGVHAQSLHRVMRALASVGVFAQDKEDRFGLTPVSEILCSRSPVSMRQYAILMGEEHYQAVGELVHTVRTGESAFNHMYRMEFFEYLSTHPEANATFNAAMHGSGNEWEDLPKLYDFRRFHKVVDVGGGRGALLAAILRANPAMHGALFDLPQVLSGAEEYLKSRGVLDRCEVVLGDALSAIPSGGDLYIMSAVLHAFQDDKAKRILDNCRSCIKSEGKLLISESVLPEGDAPSEGKMFDLIMLAVSGGLERTKGEWQSLLCSSGFELEQVIETKSEKLEPNLVTPLIEARPV